MLYFYSTPKNTKNKRKENNKLTGDNKIKKKDILYYAQILPNVGIYNGITVDDDCDGVRNGGFGSTTK